MKTRRQKNDRIATNRRNTRSKTSFSIPIDLLIDIFSRLPLKSIARCRCVSKLWSSILIRPDFTELFLTISSNRPQVLFACKVNDDLSFFSLPQSQSSPVSLNQLTRFESGFEISSHVQGLVSLIYKRSSNGRKQRVVMICNPSTGQALALPKVKSRRAKIRYLFGYDPIGKLFKVLSMTSNGGENAMCEEHQVLTLGNGKMSWRMIECCVPLRYHPRTEICIDGVLYIPSMNSSGEVYQIVCFDVRSEKFSIVHVEKPIQMPVFNGHMVNYNGKFGLLICEGTSSSTLESTRFTISVLEDVEKPEWSEHMYEFPASWKNMAGGCLVYSVGLIRTDEIVLSTCQFSSTDPLYLFYFNLETNNVARVEIQGVDPSKCKIVRTFINHVENVKRM